MDLQKEILKEHSKAQTQKIVKFIGSSPARFKELVTVFLAGPYRVTQRAAWPLAICVEHYPSLVKPHLSALLKHLDKPGIHDAVKRNTVRLLQHIEIPKRLHGKVADLCFRYLTDNKENIAVRVFSMTVLGRVAKDNPELQRELRLIIEDHLPFASPGYLSRARKVLKNLDRVSL
ncbi:MAG TPA: hypothetical protein VGD65_21270 [Chryseosolibacter sp.]